MTGRTIGRAAALARAAVLAGVLAIPEVTWAQADTVVTIFPRNDASPEGFTIPSGGQQEFGAFRCPHDGDGRPLVGADGTPGTGDDDCEAAPALWSILGPGGAGMLSTPPDVEASTTTFAAAVLQPGDPAVGAGLHASVAAPTPENPDGRQLTAISITVLPASEGDPRLAFLDGVAQETAALTLLRMGTARAIFLAALTTQMARREGRGGESTRGELRLLARLVPTDFRHRVVARDLAPGTGAASVVATLTSFAADGGVLDEVDVVLEPDGTGQLAMVPQLVVIDPGTAGPGLSAPLDRDLRFAVPTHADGLVFLRAEAGGRVVARAPDFPDAEASVVAAPEEPS